MGLFSSKKKLGYAANQTGLWYKEQHVFGKDTFRCSICGNRFDQSRPNCPVCWAKMKKTTVDPVWVDEMSLVEL